MRQSIEAVIFDLDGTLIDSMWVWSKIDEVFFEKYGYQVPSDFEAACEGKSFTETAQYVKEHYEVPLSVEEIKEEWNQLAYAFYEKQVPLKKGVKSFIEMLGEKKIKLGIATSNSKALVELVLRAHGIEDKFESIRTSCEVEKGKPFPYIYNKVAEDLEVLPERCLAFEDVPNGVLAAKRAGMHVCGVKDRQEERMLERLKEEAHYFIEDYEKVLEKVSF